MGCNCKTTEKILNIHKNYGFKMNTPWKDKARFKTREFVKYFILYSLLIILLPIIVLVVLFLAFKGNGIIKIDNILNFLLGKEKNE